MQKENNSTTQASDNIFDAYLKAIQNYFNFKGRMCRYDFWGFLLTDFLVMLFFSISAALVQHATGDDKNLSYLFDGYQVFMIIPKLSAVTRRFHDTGKSALKWLFLPLLLWFLSLRVLSAFASYHAAIVLSSFMICGFFITLYICLCQRGLAEDNKYGLVVAENEQARWKGLVIPIFMIMVPFVAGLSLAALRGYAKAMTKYKVNKTVSMVYDMLEEAKRYTDKQALAENNLSSRSDVYPTEIYRVSPFGGEIKIRRSGDVYVVTHADLPVEQCSDFRNYNWAENPDFVNADINTNCRKCLPQAPCSITLTYK